MAITEEEVVQLYDALRGRTFRGTNRGTWQSRNSWDPQIREVIATPQLEGELQRTLTAVKDRLEGQVWRGFVPHVMGWKFYVVLDGEQNEGDEGRYTIKDFEVFHITRQCQEYASLMGVSITLKVEQDTK